MVLAKNVTADDAQVSTVGSLWGYSVRKNIAFYITLRSGSVSGSILAHIEATGAGGESTVFFNKGVAASGIYANLESGTFPTGLVIYFGG